MLLEGLPYTEMVIEFTLLDDAEYHVDAHRHDHQDSIGSFIGEAVFSVRHETVCSVSAAWRLEKG